MPDKIGVLFICQHNSGRSQIAEAYLRKFAENHFSVESAGLIPAGAVNPLVIEVMKEEGVDLSEKKPQSAFELFKSGKIYSHALCANESETPTP
jgi:arsenate reductase